MSDQAERIEFYAELQSRGELDEQAAAELAEHCRDPQFAREFVAALAERAEWRQWARRNASNESFARAVLQRRQRESGSSRFSNAVMQKLQAPETRAQVKSSLAARQRRWVIGIAAAVVVSVLIYLALHAVGNRTPVAREIVRDLVQPRGESVAKLIACDTSVVTHGTKESPAIPGMELLAGDLLHVGSGGNAVIAYEDSTRVELSPEARVAFGRSDQKLEGKIVHLLAGKLQATIAPQPPGKPMIFVTAHAEATVVGTELALSTSETAASTRLQVRHGCVRMKRISDGNSIDVYAGCTTTVAPGAGLALQSSSNGSVYFVSSKGNDADGGQFQHPWREIQHAVNILKPGDVLLVEDGAYKSVYIENRHGAESQPITIQAIGSGAAIAPTLAGGISDNSIDILHCSYLTIDGLRAQEARQKAVHIKACHSITIKNGNFGSNNVGAIYVNQCDDVRLENNDCYLSRNGCGIDLAASSHRPFIRGNRVHDNSQSGILLDGALADGGDGEVIPDGLISGALIENNVVFRNGSGGMNLDGVVNATIRNNAVYDNQLTGIALYREDAASGPHDIFILHNTLDVPIGGRFALNFAHVAGPVTIRNNIVCVRDPQRAAFAFDTPAGAAQADSDYNVFAGTIAFVEEDQKNGVELKAWQAHKRDLHSVSAGLESLFIKPGSDYHLSDGSPATGTGEILTRSFPDTDGRARPENKAPDAGAFQKR